MDDNEILQRAAQIQCDRDRAYHEGIVAREREARQKHEDEERDLATEIGVTWEQFQAVKDYVSDKIYNEQR